MHSGFAPPPPHPAAQAGLPPSVQLLSNGSYHRVVSRAGSGYSQCKHLALTRWRKDASCERWGSFGYLRDRASGQVWSTTYQPTLQRAYTQGVHFSPGCAVFCRSDQAIAPETTVVVSPDDNVELRCMRIINHSGSPRALEFTSCAGIVLTTAGADTAHPAFEKRLVETEILAAAQALVCTRPARAPEEAAPALFHLLSGPGSPAAPLSCETDRARLIGRSRRSANPQALEHHAPLSGSARVVLDPVAAIRCPVFLAPGESITIDWVSGVAEHRAACLHLLEKYRHPGAIAQALKRAPRHAQAVLQGLHASTQDAQCYAAQAASFLHAHAALRAQPDVIASNCQSQSGLWAHAVLGDWPAVLLHLAATPHLELLRQLVHALGAALGPCAALRATMVLAVGQSHAIVFRLGWGATPEEARSLVQRWRGPAAAHAALQQVQQYWTQTLGSVQVRTPDRTLDILANGWLLYQVLACRLWARTAFYQSGRAFGFRDRLQDAMAPVHATPALVRAHPPAGRGVRTRCSDASLWLPLAVCRCAAVTGDTAVLDEPVDFLQGRALKEDEASYCDLPAMAEKTATLYQHCVLALERGPRQGAHGLPLMGTGGWNDGMHLVGAEGQGESVWLGFFLCAVPAHWADFAMTYRHGATPYHIEVQRAAAPSALGTTVDGVALAGPCITLVDDGTLHTVRVQLQVSTTGAQPCKSA